MSKGIFTKGISISDGNDSEIVKKLTELHPDAGDLFRKRDLVEYVAGSEASFEDKYKVGLKLGVMLKKAVDDGWLERVKVGTYRVLDAEGWWHGDGDEKKKK